MADDQPVALGTSPHPGSKTSVGLPREQNLYVRRGHMRSWPHYDELPTFRGETKQRRDATLEGRAVRWLSAVAVAERHCRHDMMIMIQCLIPTLIIFKQLYKRKRYVFV